MDIQIKTFEQLTKEELYELLALRSEVFVVEQECVYQDIDFKDQKALHVLGKKNGQLMAYTRVFNAYDYFEKASIGRVLVSGRHREHGYGHMILKASIEAIYSYFKKQPILISAQQHLEQFYNLHGFFTIGDGYLEDGIPHIKMLKDQS
ncbi:GNAT family N-acetyltransferase [Galbibacter sp.]|uniref:GNAT family N-acetyltransferase n=1 Tax=Galbibacter sp. TaxID=2918471 RepID=UPI002B8B9685|nr:GNAT family N-acetyltransferase [Galbibacter sp.]HLV63007.1 GNAT family N-acetyltransferase [Galbibacter sp.]